MTTLFVFCRFLFRSFYNLSEFSEVRQNSFKATNWLNQTSSNRGSAFAMPETEELSSNDSINSFQPAGFFTPGWSGESLISKNGVKVKRF